MIGARHTPNYLVQYAKDYAAAGVPLTYLGPENEANRSRPVPQDSMIMSPAQTANFMQVLGETLARSGLSTRAECCASIGWNYAQQYAAAIEADKTANAATALFTSHGYFVAPDSPLRGWSKPVWETEWAPFDTGPFDPAWDDGSPSSGFTWAQNIYTGLTAANLGAFLYLWGANTSPNDRERRPQQRDWSTSRATPSPPLVGCGRSRATAASSARVRCASTRRRATRASR